MNADTIQIHRPGRDVSVLNDQLEVPGVGVLPINAFVLHAAEPVVIDTGLSLPDAISWMRWGRSSTPRTCGGSG